MTTTVTVKTYGHPASVAVHGCTSLSTDQYSSFSNFHNAEFLPANSEKDFTVSGSSSVSVSELPEGSAGLNGPETGQLQAAAVSS